MDSVPPLQSFLLMIVSGWVHRHQLIVIEFLQAENQVLKKRLGGKRIRFTDAERALLGRKAKAVGRKALLELDTVVSPDTLLRWHRQFVVIRSSPVVRNNSRRRRFSVEHLPARADSGMMDLWATCSDRTLVSGEKLRTVSSLMNRGLCVGLKSNPGPHSKAGYIRSVYLGLQGR